MIESALVFALGLLTAGFLALLLFPAFNRRAVRLAWREAEARLPRNMNEITAARDAVRAVYAAKVARAEVEARESRDALVEERLVRSEIESQMAAVRSEKSALATALAETEARLALAHDLIRSREEALAQANADLREMERRAVADAGRIRAAERRIQDLEAALERMRSDAASAAGAVDWAEAGRLDPLAGPLIPTGPVVHLPRPDAYPAREAEIETPEPATLRSSPLNTVLKSLQSQRSRLEAEAHHLGIGRPPSEPLRTLDPGTRLQPVTDGAESAGPRLAQLTSLTAPATALPGPDADDADALVARPRITELARRIRLGREKTAVAEDLEDLPMGKRTDPEA